MSLTDTDKLNFLSAIDGGNKTLMHKYVEQDPECAKFGLRYALVWGKFESATSLQERGASVKDLAPYLTVHEDKDNHLSRQIDKWKNHKRKAPFQKIASFFSRKISDIFSANARRTDASTYDTDAMAVSLAATNPQAALGYMIAQGNLTTQPLAMGLAVTNIAAQAIKND